MDRSKEQEIADLERQQKVNLELLRTVETALAEKKKEKLRLETDIAKLKELLPDLIEKVKQARYVVEITKINISLKIKEFWSEK
jgi:hypothetical protein